MTFCSRTYRLSVLQLCYQCLSTYLWAFLRLFLLFFFFFFFFFCLPSNSLLHSSNTHAGVIFNYFFSFLYLVSFPSSFFHFLSPPRHFLFFHPSSPHTHVPPLFCVCVCVRVCTAVVFRRCVQLICAASLLPPTPSLCKYLSPLWPDGWMFVSVWVNVLTALCLYWSIRLWPIFDMTKSAVGIFPAFCGQLWWF